MMEKSVMGLVAARARRAEAGQKAAAETEASTIISLQGRVIELQAQINELLPYKAKCEEMEARPAPEPQPCVECATLRVKLDGALTEISGRSVVTEMLQRKYEDEVRARAAAEVTCADATARLAAEREERAKADAVTQQFIAMCREMMAEEPDAPTDDKQWKFTIQRDGANNMIGVVAEPRSAA